MKKISILLICISLTVCYAVDKGSLALGWEAGHPVVRYWLQPEMALEVGANFSMTSVSGGAPTDTGIALSAKGLKVLKSVGSLNISAGVGLEITSRSNAYNQQDRNISAFGLGVLLDFEYFVKAVPNVSLGAMVGIAFVSTTDKITVAGVSVSQTSTTICPTGGLSLGGLSIKYYFK